MRRIYIDLSICGNNNGFVSGAGEYGLVIFSELKKLMLNNLYMGANISVNLDDSIYKDFPVLNILRYKNIDELNKYLSDNNIDVVFLPQLLHSYIDLNTNAKIIAVLHDIGDILDIENNKKDYYGKYYELTLVHKIKFFIKSHLPFIMDSIIQRKINAYNQLLRKFENFQLITVSHYSKSTIDYYLNIENINLNVFYSPLKISEIYSDINLSDEIKNKYGVSDYKYFLFCNSKRVRKNNSIALLAFDDFITKTKKTEYKAVILGSDSKYEKYIIPKLKNKSNFKFYSYVGKDEFEALYKFAHLFVFPSILEGFGSPPVEALKYGTLCACSSLTSIPEICQDAVIYFNPFDLHTIEYAYYQSFDDKFVSHIKQKIKERYSCLCERQKMDLNSLIQLIIS